MIGLVFATRFEARPFLEISRADSVHQKPFRIFTANVPARLPIIISGIGKVAAAVASHILIRDFGVDYILNAGACGALHDSPELGMCNLVRIATAVEGDHTPFDRHLAPLLSGNKYALFLPAVRLATSDKPVLDPQTRGYFSRLGDVVDMEGGAIARTAALYGIPWDMIKGVSDPAGVLDRDTLRQNITRVSEKISEMLMHELQSAQ